MIIEDLKIPYVAEPVKIGFRVFESFENSSPTKKEFYEYDVIIHKHKCYYLNNLANNVITIPPKSLNIKLNPNNLKSHLEQLPPDTYLGLSEHSNSFNNLINFLIGSFNEALIFYVDFVNAREPARSCAYAKSILFCLDNIVKIIYTIQRYHFLNVNNQISLLDTHFKDIKGIRDSAHHVEDRAFMRNKNQKKITPQSFDKYGIKASSITSMGSIITYNNIPKYTWTTNDGTLGELDITEATITTFNTIVVEILSLVKKTYPIT